MMQIVNIDSSMAYLITPGIEVSLTKRLSFLGDKFCRTPFYLVNEKTMNCLYPPQKRRGLKEDRLRSMMQQKTAFKDILDECWDEIDIENVFVAVGLYLPVINGAKECVPDIPEELQNNNGKGAIFVCPERVDKWSKKIGITFINSGIKQDIFGTLFQKVAIHELAHAFMDGGKDKWDEYLNNPCYRIIEESLANAVSYTHFNAVESVIVSRAISKQPLEYRGYVHWLDSRFWRNDYFWRHERDIFLNPINPKGAIKIFASWWKRNYLGTDEIMRIAESVVETII